MENMETRAGHWSSTARLMVLAMGKEKVCCSELHIWAWVELWHRRKPAVGLVCTYGTRELELVTQPQGWLDFNVQGELWFGRNN